MEQLSQRIETTARHLGLVDALFMDVDPVYRLLRERLEQAPTFEQFARSLYLGQKERQMILGDLLLYILTGRGYWSAVGSQQGFRDYVVVVMRIVNLLLRQESILSGHSDLRREVMQRLESESLRDFFASPKEEQLYEQLANYDGMVQPRDRRRYPVMDSLVPRSIGAAIELLVYVYLLKRPIGYVVSLLFTQRLFRGQETLAPPDYLLLRPGGDTIGIEVGGGMGQFSLQRGKIDQINRFVQDTSMASVTAVVPHLYRCPICNDWINFCEQVIKRTAVSWEGDQEFLSCVTCPRFEGGNCSDIIYRGRTQPRETELHYHYRHCKENQYVENIALASPTAKERRLRHYFPHVVGLERFSVVS